MSYVCVTFNRSEISKGLRTPLLNIHVICGFFFQSNCHLSCTRLKKIQVRQNLNSGRRLTQYSKADEYSSMNETLFIETESLNVFKIDIGDTQQMKS